MIERNTHGRLRHGGDVSFVTGTRCTEWQNITTYRRLQLAASERAKRLSCEALAIAITRPHNRSLVGTRTGSQWLFLPDGSRRED